MAALQRGRGYKFNGTNVFQFLQLHLFEDCKGLTVAEKWDEGYTYACVKTQLISFSYFTMTVALDRI